MATSNYASPATATNYDPRWFIWTIVFLVVTGISLVSYIVLSDSSNDDVPDFTPVRVSAQRTMDTK